MFNWPNAKMLNWTSLGRFIITWTSIQLNTIVELNSPGCPAPGWLFSRTIDDNKDGKNLYLYPEK